MTRYRREYSKIARKLTTADIQAGVAENELSLENLLTDGRVTADSNFFLGVFSRLGLVNAVRAFGLQEILNKAGLTNLRLEIDTSDPHTHRLYAFNGTPQPENTICELVLKRGPVHFNTGVLPNFPARNPNLLQVEWLLLQHPLQSFSASRPPLPGQVHPGLGIGDRLMEILIILTNRVRLEGIINKPRYCHTAFMFSKEFVFTNPVNQAIMYAISKNLLSKYSFYLVAWAAHFKCIMNTRDHAPLIWEPDFLMLPLAKDLIKYFRSREYQQRVNELTRQYNFTIDHASLRALMLKNDLEPLGLKQ